MENIYINFFCFIGMTAALVFFLVHHETLTDFRSGITKKHLAIKKKGRQNYFYLFLHKLIDCDYCCGFWMGCVSFLCIVYFPVANYIFTAAIVSYLLLNKE